MVLNLTNLDFFNQMDWNCPTYILKLCLLQDVYDPCIVIKGTDLINIKVLDYSLSFEKAITVITHLWQALAQDFLPGLPA